MTQAVLSNQPSCHFGRPLPLPMAFEVPRRAEHSSSLATVFSREYAKRTTMAFGMWFFALIGCFGLNSWIAILLASAAAAWMYGNSTGQSVLFASGFVIRFFMFGMWSCLYAYTPELYPTRARSTGAGLASAAGRLGAILGPTVVPMLVRVGGQAAAFEVGAAGFVIAATLVLYTGRGDQGTAAGGGFRMMGETAEVLAQFMPEG
jgi:putative MFS transporter